MTPVTKADIDRLRRRIERVEGGRMDPDPVPKTAEPDAAAAEDGSPFTVHDFRPEHYSAEQTFDGEVMETPYGSYFLSERLYPNHKLHGSYEISRLADMPGAWLEKISKGEISDHAPSRWVFLDTETTGLAGGTGTCAFLVGIGTIEDDGFRVRLFFMRDYDEESAMLWGLSEFLSHYDVLVTYNGKSYDAPLIETRYRLRRIPNPLDRLRHLDLLHGARSLWKLRMESCRLMNLEREILGVERQGDLPGELIPYYYFEYLRTKQSFKLVPLFHHNVIDIVSLACLTGVVLPVFASPEEAALHAGQDFLGLARWLRRAGALETAADVYRKAVEKGMMDDELFAALWEAALVEKKRKNREAMVELFGDLAESRNPYQARACVELAKHHERTEKNFERALATARRALELEPSEDHERRCARLAKRLAKAAGKGAALFTAAD